MLDGEVVVLKPDGTSSFQALQDAFRKGRPAALVYYAFDTLHLDGNDITGVPLETRKKILNRLIQNPHPSIRFSDSIQGSGPDVIDKACHLHLEGVVSKRRGSLYRPGRGMDWLKIKCEKREEFVIGGFTKPGGGRAHFGALLVGTHDHAGNLVYAGGVGTGFNGETLSSLHHRMKKLVQTRSPFSNFPTTNAEARDVSWVKPVLVAEVKFANWADDGMLRHASFLGIREDKPAKDVTREEPHY
jgi:bifunctional non-homologous end joining protein LigD